MTRKSMLDAERDTADPLLSGIVLAPESFSSSEDDGRRPATAERRRYLKLQGAYVGSLRRLTLPQKERVKALRARGGEEAVARARKLAK